MHGRKFLLALFVALVFSGLVCAAKCGELSSGRNATGTHCWDYGESHPSWDENNFACNNDVQINIGEPCLVKCTLDRDGGDCRCSLQKPCIDECLDAFWGSCSVDHDFKCTGPEYGCSGASTPETKCDSTASCKTACAQECGRETSCGLDCSECCMLTTCGKTTYSSKEYENCMGSCEGICKANEQTCYLMMLLEIIGAVVTAVEIAMNGLKWIISDDPEARADARHGLWYVVVGIIFGAIALALVSYILDVSLLCYI